MTPTARAGAFTVAVVAPVPAVLLATVLIVTAAWDRPLSSVHFDRTAWTAVGLSATLAAYGALLARAAWTPLRARGWQGASVGAVLGALTAVLAFHTWFVGGALVKGASFDTSDVRNWLALLVQAWVPPLVWAPWMALVGAVLGRSEGAASTAPPAT